MWFKRRKKSEQDHALSESLKSLQTLLNDADRVEPSLERRHSGNDEPDESAGSRGRPAPAGSRAASRSTGAGGRDRPGEPSPTPEPGNRWRDLNLSFDAEPVVPKSRRDTRTEAEPPPPDASRAAAPVSDISEPPAPEDSAEPEPDNEPVGPDAPVGEHPEDEAPGEPLDLAGAPGIDLAEFSEPDGQDEPDAEAPALDVAAGAAGPAASPPPLPADEPASDAVDEEYAAPAGGDLEASEQGLEAAAEDLAADLEVEAEEFEIGPPVAGQDGFGAPAATQEAEEDQLHLELELDEESEDDIPTLTDAIYVPDKASPEPAPPGPDESPYDENVDKCIDNLRVRLQLMGLEALSPGQEKELHDTLVEFLDDLGLREDD